MSAGFGPRVLLAPPCRRVGVAIQHKPGQEGLHLFASLASLSPHTETAGMLGKLRLAHGADTRLVRLPRGRGPERNRDIGRTGVEDKRAVSHAGEEHLVAL